MTGIDTNELRRLWFLLKGEQGRVTSQPEFLYDEHFSFFMRSDKALYFLDAFMNEGKYDKKNIRENFETWRVYLEKNNIAPRTPSGVKEENRKLDEGFTGPFVMPDDIKLARRVVNLVKDFTAYKDPESYDSAILFSEYGIHYVPVTNILNWIDVWLRKEN